MSQKPHGNGSRRRWISAGFSMIELLVVIAITTIILGLLFGPMIQAFRITNRTQAQTAAQDASRYGLERLGRELREASFVYDNSYTPIVFPVGTHNGVTLPGNNARPRFLFAKLEFVPSATVAPSATKGIDPTTGGQLGGADLQFPLAPATSRVVRYFIGLQRNLPVNGNPAVYTNPYEFRADGSNFNPFILYRAEFDPRDPNLIDQSVAISSAADFTDDSAGFNDPNFFYNTRRAPNGRTYAENWRDVSSPVLSTTRLDLLAWNRDDNGDVSTTNPFRPTVTFAPSTVVGDTATPGYLTDTANEAPAAIPSLYTAQNGLWVAPYSVTFYRFASQNNTTNAAYGYITARVSRDDVSGRFVVDIVDSGGSLLVDKSIPSNFTYSFGARGGIFVKTKSVTFQIDPLRGRIITGFQPLAGINGVPVFDSTTGEPIQTIFRQNTLNPKAIPGSPVYDPAYPTNGGLIEADLTEKRYFALFDPSAPAVGSLSPTDTAGTDSPFVTFGGALVVTGSERVLGPDSDRLRDLGNTTTPVTANDVLVPYHRISILDSFSRTSTGAVDQPLYKLGLELNPVLPRLEFDEVNPTSTQPSQGLAAKASGAPGAEKEIQASFLWLTNYARDITGMPIDANGNSVAGTSNQPEADVVKVDYSTRSLFNIRLGARVYDANSGRPTTIESTDKIKVNNIGR